MTRYQELSAQAADLALRLNRIEVQCRQKASVIVQRFSQLLEAPEGRVASVSLAADLSVPRDAKASAGWPEVVQGADGVCYFGLHVTYGDPRGTAWISETIVLGIRAEADPAPSFGLRLLDSPERRIGNDNELDAFLDEMIADTEKRLANAYQRRPHGMGFTMSEN
jgi:hypothetical protein